jgi:MFS family permease
MLASNNLAASFPGGIRFGLNPFSACALAAFALSVVNYFWVLTRFPETLPKEKRAAAVEAEPKISRLESIFHTDLPAIRRANLVNLFYTVAFSGMEFTLTFLAAERFKYSSHGMVKIFVFMGLVMVVAQGMFRGKRVSKLGEKKSAIFGLVCGSAGFLILAFALRQRWFYLGLAVFAVSAGFTSVCLPSLVSLYSDAKSQGRHIGTVRAAQALGRAIGPLFFAVIYFWAGSKVSYMAGAVALLLPLWMAYKLPVPRKDSGPVPAH